MAYDDHDVRKPGHELRGSEVGGQVPRLEYQAGQHVTMIHNVTAASATEVDHRKGTTPFHFLWFLLYNPAIIGLPHLGGFLSHRASPSYLPNFHGILLQDWPRLLSLGEQQRLAFARLLLNAPRYAVTGHVCQKTKTLNRQWKSRQK